MARDDTPVSVKSLKRLGYKKLVAVTCGEGKSRKAGFFLGGHHSHSPGQYDKQVDYYVECSCSKCAQSGCALRVGEFERHAESAAKKWKESIKVEAGGKTKQSLEKWIDARCREYGAALVGKRAHTCWLADPKHGYSGTVVAWDKDFCLHTVRYDDGQVEYLKWVAENTKLLDDHPGAFSVGTAASSPYDTQGAAVALAAIWKRQQQSGDSAPGRQERQAAGAIAAAGGVGPPEGPADHAGTAEERKLQALLVLLPAQQREELRAAREQLALQLVVEAGLRADISELQWQAEQLRARSATAAEQLAVLQQERQERADAAAQQAQRNDELSAELQRLERGIASVEAAWQAKKAATERAVELARQVAEATAAGQHLAAQFGQLIQPAGPPPPGGGGAPA